MSAVDDAFDAWVKDTLLVGEVTVGERAAFRAGYRRAVADVRVAPKCDCDHAAIEHDNVRPSGERVIDGRDTPCEQCSCIDFRPAEQPQ